MQIKLTKLVLENFMGIRQFSFEPKGKAVTIRGANATGKTSLFSAFLWLLFGKDSQGKADFAMKTLRAGQEIPNLEHSVEGIFDIDGSALMLKKVLKEKYTKKRGTSRADFTGHKVDHYIDGVPVQKKDWDQQIHDIIDEETFKLLTSPTYFNFLHWEKHRSILLEVCGDVSDSDVISSNKVLAVLPEILGNRSIEDQKKVIASKRKEINQRLTEIPSRIDELDKSLADVSEYDVKAIQSQILELDKEIQAMRDDTKASLLRKQKAELQAKLSNLEMDKALSERRASHTHDEKIDAFEKELRPKKLLADSAPAAIATAEHKIRNNKEIMNRLRDEYSIIARTKVDVEDTCPTCGQPLPKDQVDKAIKKHNERQAQQLADVNAKGKQLKTENAQLTIEIEGTVKDALANDKVIKNIEAQIEALRETANAKPVDMPEIHKVKTEIQKIEKQLADNLPSDTGPLETKRSLLQAQIAEVEATGKTKIRIEELKAEEKKLATEYEELERQISLLEKFTVAKVELLEEKINKKFSLARFKMFEKQINEGIKETCITLYNGVPYGYGLNSGAEINVGLDIVKTLSEHYGVKAPIFIDHSESVTDILDPGTQTIKLIVDKDYPKMEVSNE